MEGAFELGRFKVLLFENRIIIVKGEIGFILFV